MESEFSTETLGGVACPVLLVAGTDDESTRRAQGKRFADANPLARYVELDGAGHAVHRKCRDKFAEVISAFLTEVDSEKAGSHATGQEHLQSASRPLKSRLEEYVPGLGGFRTVWIRSLRNAIDRARKRSDRFVDASRERLSERDEGDFSIQDVVDRSRPNLNVRSIRFSTAKTA